MGVTHKVKTWFSRERHRLNFKHHGWSSQKQRHSYVEEHASLQLVLVLRLQPLQSVLLVVSLRPLSIVRVGGNLVCPIVATLNKVGPLAIFHRQGKVTSAGIWRK